MKSVTKTRPNWLFRFLLIISIGVHALIFMHITGLYRSRALTVIELTLMDVSKPETRNIPRPRLRNKNIPKPEEIKQPTLIQRRAPSFKPFELEPVEKDLPESLVENISIPRVKSDPDISISEWVPPKIEPGDYLTREAYLEMVRLRIENEKRYPEEARSSRIEGSVVVGFVITPDGNIKTVEIVKRSRSPYLDEAAITAVKSAAPFPKPPERLFQGEVSLNVTVVFELT